MKFSKIEIVKFKNGEYGVRKTSWFGLRHTYRSLYNDWWWSNPYRVHQFCKGNLYLAKAAYNGLEMDKGTPV